MSDAPDATQPEHVLRAMLQQDNVCDLINQELAGRNLPYAVHDLPEPLQLQLVQALISDGVVSVGPGRVLTPEEFLAICEAEERALSEPADNDPPETR